MKNLFIPQRLVFQYNTAGNLYGEDAYSHAKPKAEGEKENWIKEGVMKERVQEYGKRYEKFKKRVALQKIDDSESGLLNIGGEYTDQPLFQKF